MPRIATSDEWLAARKDLLVQEKEASRAKDALDAARRALQMVEIDKKYVFTGPEGQAGLLELFEGRRQLIVYHFMWRHEQSGFPGQDQGCPTCSVVADNIGHLSHLHACDTTLVLVSRAPSTSITRFRSRMGWAVPWYSSLGSDFNYDFHVSFDEKLALERAAAGRSDKRSRVTERSVAIVGGKRRRAIPRLVRRSEERRRRRIDDLWLTRA